MTTLLDEVKEKSSPHNVNASPPEFAAQPDLPPSQETITVSGESLWHKLKELIHQGNIRRILIKNESGHLLLEIPVTAGVVGGVAGIMLFPEFVAIGVIGSMFAHLTLTIERRTAPPHRSEKSQ